MNLLPIGTGAGLYLVAKAAVSYSLLSPLNLLLKKQDVASAIASFSFTALGVLAASSSILLVFTNRAAFKRYRDRGNLPIFMSLYLFSVLFLSSNSLLAIANMGTGSLAGLFQAMLCLFCITLAQLIVLFIIVFNLTLHSMHESSKMEQA